jgi:ankyrin repeat protein
MHYDLISFPKCSQVSLFCTEKHRANTCEALEIQGAYGRTPLHMAAFFQDVLSVFFTTFRTSVLNIYVQDIDGRTPLHNAAEQGRKIIILFDRTIKSHRSVRNSNSSDWTTN